MNKKRLSRRWQALKTPFYLVSGFAVLYRLTIIMFLFPLSRVILSTGVRLTGQNFLIAGGLRALMSKPVFILALLLTLFLIGLVILFEVAVLIRLSCHRRIALNLVLNDLKTAGRDILCVPGRRQWLLLLLALALWPLFAHNLSYDLHRLLSVPEFIREFIQDSFVLSLLSGVLTFIYGLFWVFASLVFHEAFLKKQRAWPALRRSFTLVKMQFRAFWSQVLKPLLLTQILLQVVYTLILLVSAALLLRFVAHRVWTSILLSLLSFVQPVFYVLRLTLLITLLFATTGQFFQRLHPDLQEPEELNNVVARRLTKKRKWKLALLGFILVLVLTLNTFLVYSALVEDRLPVFNPKQITLMAHRGSERAAPENTMAAFQQAIEDRADVIELDAQLTADQRVVIFHDADLRRIAGRPGRISDLTYDDLKDLDVGSWFAPQFADQRIPTLEAVLRFCRGKIRLNIELKTAPGTGHILATQVANLVMEENMTKEARICSFDYVALQTVKQVSGGAIRTALVTVYPLGDYVHLGDIDELSIEKNSITPELVAGIHLSGKQVLAWTTADSGEIERLAAAGVDGIITQDPLAARAALSSQDLEAKLLEWVMPQSDDAP